MEPLFDIVLEDVPEVVPLVVEPVEPLLEYEPEPLPMVAFFRTHSPERELVALVLPVVPVAPVEPLSVPRSRQPVTVIVLLLL